MGKYTESNSCLIMVEYTYPGDSVEIATDVDELDDSDSGDPPAIWVCNSAAGSSNLAIRRVAAGRPGHHPLGLSAFSMDRGVLTLQVADDNIKKLASTYAKASDDFMLSSFIEIHVYVWAMANTKSVTLYCEAGPDNKITVQLCGQSKQFIKPQSSITFDWINQYVGG